jgi:hypothetical protein
MLRGSMNLPPNPSVPAFITIYILTTEIISGIFSAVPSILSELRCLAWGRRLGAARNVATNRN